MTKDEEKALQDDNQYFMTDEHNNYGDEILWFLSITAICSLILLGIFILEVMEL